MSRRGARRAFALPLVLALVVVVSMMSAVMLERQSAQRLLVARQLDWYQEHHVRLGLQEAIEAWLKSLPSSLDIGAILPADGHFLDLGLKDGTEATVFFQERQNAVLTDLAAVDDASLDAAAAIADAAARAFGQEGPPDGLRTVGPASISAHTASAALLEVAAEAVIGDGAAGKAFAAGLINDREANGGRCSASAVGMAASGANLEPDARTLVSRMFTVRPTLYYATVELRASPSAPVLARYGGYFVVGTPRAGSAVGSRSAFLTWENLGVE